MLKLQSVNPLLVRHKTMFIKFTLPVFHYAKYWISLLTLCLEESDEIKNNVFFPPNPLNRNKLKAYRTPNRWCLISFLLNNHYSSFYKRHDQIERGKTLFIDFGRMIIKVLGLNSKRLVISSTVLVFNTIIIKSLSSPERWMAKVNTLVFRTLVGVTRGGF